MILSRVLLVPFVAVVLVFAIFASFSTLTNDNPTINVFTYSLVWMLLLFVLIRYGILAAVLTFVFANLPSFIPLTLDFSKWHSTYSLLAAAFLLTLTGFGLYISITGKAFSLRRILPD